MTWESHSYDEIDSTAPYSEAFVSVGMRWAGRIVSLGALTGIVTSVLVNLLGQSRILVALGRQHLLPPWIVSLLLFAFPSSMCDRQSSMKNMVRLGTHCC